MVARLLMEGSIAHVSDRCAWRPSVDGPECTLGRMNWLLKNGRTVSDRGTARHVGCNGKNRETDTPRRKSR